MTTLSISLDDKVASRLKAEADRRRMTSDELVEECIAQLLGGPDCETMELVQQIIEENKELYRRLA